MLSIEHLYFSYQGQPPYVLNDLNLHIHSGDYISIVGDNGCGKSTLLRLILGFLTPVKGSIKRSTNNIRYVSQKNDFSHAGFPITVKEILDSYRKLLKIKDKQEVNRVLELTHMTEFKDRLISKLSGGQAQRVSIARALIGKPDLIILDEPSTGIDRKSQEGIYALLRNLNQEHHITIISVEHNIEMALANSTNIYHIANGQGHLCSPEQYASEIMHSTGRNPIDHKNCSCFTDVTIEAQAQAQAQAQAAHDRPSAQDHGRDADILADWLQAHGLALVDQPTTMIRLAASRPDTNTPAGAGPQNAPQARTATVCALAAQALG